MWEFNRLKWGQLFIFRIQIFIAIKLLQSIMLIHICNKIINYKINFKINIKLIRIYLLTKVK